MEYNIISEYVDYIKKTYLSFFRILLKNKYNRSICEKFVNKYIDVRYYNETNYPKIKDILNRVNKELVDVYEDVYTINDENMLKNIVALFGYILYFDEVYQVTEDVQLVDALIKDENIKIDHDDETKKELRDWYIAYRKNKNKFDGLFESKEFGLLENQIYRKTYMLKLEQNVKISNLYSEYAIDRSFNTGVINEDKQFITYIMASNLILTNAKRLDFSRKYIVDLPNSLFSKIKKMNRLFEILNNPLAKKEIIVKLCYNDYIKNRDMITSRINKGYLFALEIDDNFDGNMDEFVLFPYVLVDEENEYYDAIMNEKDKIDTKIVRI